MKVNENTSVSNVQSPKRNHAYVGMECLFSHLIRNTQGPFCIYSLLNVPGG